MNGRDRAVRQQKRDLPLLNNSPLPRTYGLKGRALYSQQQRTQNMNTSRSTDLQSPSPASGIRARIGHVVRWHAEPVNTETARENREANEPAETRNNANPARPL
jgi:hypothetical protein